MGPSYDQQICCLLLAQVEDYFPKPTHSKEGSASTTATDPLTHESTEEIDLMRLSRARAKNKQHVAHPGLAVHG